MYEIPILIIKGFIIGLAKIIPGVSGSLFALNLGLYERGIDAIDNFFKKTKENIYFLGTIGIGILIAIIFGSNIINYMLIHYYVLTMLLFIGLLSGSIPNLITKTNIKTKKEFLYFFITFFIMIIICFVKINNEYVYINNLPNNLFVFFIGMIDAATMIIPGISGTAILMLMGCYQFFLSIFVNITNLSNINIILFFTLGLVIGIIIVTKIMNYLLNKKKDLIYPIILGFSLSSIIILLIQTITKISDIIQIFIGLPIMLLGFKIAKKMDFK
jgi:putative membrane protein